MGFRSRLDAVDAPYSSGRAAVSIGWQYDQQVAGVIDAVLDERRDARGVDCSYETFESHDGLEIEALVYDSGRRPSPVVVKVHGAPAAQDLKQFDLCTEFLATRGYSVL